MQIVSVNTGLPREVLWKGTPVMTGVFKEPVAGAAIRRLNLDGDRQADLTVHGGAQKAVYAYPAEHYAYWRGQLPGERFRWGHFGENLTTAGLEEHVLFIGDRLQVGSAVLVVTQPRMPCYKLAVRFDRDDIVKRFLDSRRSGFYFSVEREGEVAAGSGVEILSRDAEQVSVSDIVRLYLEDPPDLELLHRALRVEALPESWKASLRQRAEARQHRV